MQEIYYDLFKFFLAIVIVGEMWQTLILRLEQTSGFQWLGIQTGLQVKF